MVKDTNIAPNVMCEGGPTKDLELEFLRKRVTKLERVQEVIIAAGLVSKEKFEQAYEIVRSFKD